MTGLFENIQRSVDPTVILLMVAVIAVCATVFMCVTWNVEPWTRKYLKPHKQLRMDRYRIKIWKLRSRYPEAFEMPTPFKEQHLDAEKFVEDVVDHVAEKEGVDVHG